MCLFANAWLVLGICCGSLLLVGLPGCCDIEGRPAPGPEAAAAEEGFHRKGSSCFQRLTAWTS